MEKNKDKDLFKDLINNKIGEDEPIKGDNDELIWQNVLNKIDAPSKTLKNNYLVYAIAASISLILIFSVSYYFINIKTDNNIAANTPFVETEPPTSQQQFNIEDTTTANEYVNQYPKEIVDDKKNNANTLASAKPDFSKAISLVSNREIEQHTLPDKSIVTLNKFATLSYIDNFKQERNLILEGEAYFEVKNNNTPFYVYFGNYKLQVVGTKFNIRNLSGEESKEITVTEGRVKVSTENTEIYLSKGEQLILRGNHTPSVNRVDPSNYITWVSGNLYFNNTSLDIVFEILSRQYGKNYEVDSNVKHCKFTGDLSDIDENEAVMSICLTNSLTTENKNNVVIVKGRGCD